MSKRIVKEYSPEFKVKIVLEALKEEETTNQIASRYEVNPRNIQSWRKQFIDNAEIIFNKDKGLIEYKKKLKEKEVETEELYKEIGRLTTRVNWMEKKIKAVELRN